jgi:serine phosphatase RsbU (regulator of sigma subunit)/anti-anti-sigma regulatory factor
MTSEQSDPLALVADDDPVTRRLVLRSLERLGFRSVLQAHDGAVAQSILRERSDVDLVVTDILMPNLDGLELLRWGREHVPDVVWIILSGLDTFDSAVEAIRLGAFDFLAKPPNVAELEVAVRNALERRTLLVERERLHAELRQSNERLVEQVRELEEKSELLQRDLERAEVIQRALLPSAPPPIERFCVHSLYRAGQHVGGDLYDVVRVDEHSLALYVADATGHGITSAMLSVLFKQRLVLRDESGRPLSPAAVLEAANRSMRDAVAAPGLFLTAVYCLLDTRDGRITLASAGHPPVVHVCASGETHLIERTGPALGLTADASFDEVGFRLEPGDRLLLYTDGLIQPGAASEPDRLPELLRPQPDAAGDLLEELLRAASREGRAEDRDDVTLLLLEGRPGSSGFDNGQDQEPASSATTPGPSGLVHHGETEDTSYLALRGRATWSQSALFFETARAVQEAGRPLVLDLSACDYLDSTFLGTIHELVDRDRVRLQNVRPEVRALFEELCMERVLTSIREEEDALPALRPLAPRPDDPGAGRRRILEAHEALSALSTRNRESFSSVIDSLRGGPERG